ncbi:MAG: diaminopropionate ammonia-lyase [Dethiobacteria bacterium]
MEESIKWIVNPKARNEDNIKRPGPDFLGGKAAAETRNFMESFPQYEVTPLRNLGRLAAYTGIAGIYVKDESYRFGLNSFKVLGGGHAIGRYLAGKLNLSPFNFSYAKLRSDEAREKLGEITFTSATDGNHGRGVAWAARQLGHRAVINMPKGSSPIRLEHITATGAEGYITDVNYDETVRITAENANKNGWVVIQDTAWEGYEDIPNWIIQGYTVMADEAYKQIQQYGFNRPTHIFIQAGVGSLAAAVLGFFASMLNNIRPVTVIVEPDKADCFYKSALAGDGIPRYVTGDLDTIMAGLACGEPNPFAWDILKDMADMFISCPDYISAKGMRILGNPLSGDTRVISGESGAVTTGMLVELLLNEELAEAREGLKLDQDSRVLVFSTEGDTDPEMYRKIVWDGAYPVPGKSHI